MAIIENGLDATLMRNKMESKDALANKGALYVGTGDVTPVTHKNKQGADETTNVPKTTSVAPNGRTDDGKVLIADSTKPEGWKIDKIGNDNITNGAITGDKLAENFTYITSDTSSFCLQDSSNNSTPRLSFVESNNNASVILQANLKSQELDGESFTLTVPNEDGTLATKEQIESGEIVAKTAQNATYAQYASEDTTKGTIEERLTRLGFNLGYITLNSDVALWPQFSSDMILDEGRTQLQILRCGNYVMIPTQIMRNGSSGKSLEPLYFTAQVKLTGGEIIGTISNNCIPDRTQIIVGTINIDDKLAGTGTVFVEQFLIKGRDGAPEDLWNLGGVGSIWTQVNEAPIGSIIYLNVSHKNISSGISVHFPYVGPTPVNSGYSDYRWTVPSDFSVKNLTSISLYSTPID